MEKKKDDGLALASFLMSILSYVFLCILIGEFFSISGLILGIMAFKYKTKKPGFAIAGIILSAINIILFLILIILLITPATPPL